MFLNEGYKGYSDSELKVIASGFTQVKQIHNKSQTIVIEFESGAHPHDKINQLSKSVNNDSHYMFQFVFEYVSAAHIDVSNIMCLLQISCKADDVFCKGEGEIYIVNSEIKTLHSDKMSINVNDSYVEKVIGGHIIDIFNPTCNSTEIIDVKILKYTSREYRNIKITNCYMSEVNGANIYITGTSRHLSAVTNDVNINTTCKIMVKISVFTPERSKKYILNSLTEVITFVNRFSSDWSGFTNLYFEHYSHSLIAIMADDKFRDDYKKHKNLITLYLGLFNPHNIEQLIDIETDFRIISNVINHFVNNGLLISIEMLIDILFGIVERIKTYSNINYADFASWIDIIFRTGGYNEERDKFTEILLQTGLWNNLSYTTKRHGINCLMSCMVSESIKLLPSIEPPKTNYHCYNNNLLFKISLFEPKNLSKNQVRQLKSKYNDSGSKQMIDNLYNYMDKNKLTVLNNEGMKSHDCAPVVEWDCFDKTDENKILTNHIINIDNLSQYIERTSMSSQTYNGNDQYTMFAVCCTPFVQNKYIMRHYYKLTEKHPRALVPYTMGWVRYTINNNIVIVSEIQTDFPKFLTIEKILIDSDSVYDILINNVFKLFLSHIYEDTSANVIVVPTGDTRLLYLGGCEMQSVYDKLPKKYGMKISFNEYIEGAYNVRQVQRNR